ncbi:MAG: superoxide dismutase [Bacteroidetes bacterium]|nr:superoxide dismutase [Bacteroidota bacterium]
MNRRKFITGSIAGAGLLAIDKKTGLSEIEKHFLTKNQKGVKSKMAYEWKFNKRPYTDEEAKELLKEVIDAQTTDWHYNTHHKGYVTFMNNIEKELETADRSKANGNYSNVGELKRRFTWNHAGALLHDVYWEVLGGDGDVSKGPEVAAAIEKEFGSVDNWKTDFKATAVSAKLSGWAVLTYDQLYSQRLLDVLVDEHHYGAIWGGIPIISCDVFEHAYYHKDGPGRAVYIDNFLKNLNWARINDRYKKYAVK